MLTALQYLDGAVEVVMVASTNCEPMRVMFAARPELA